MHLRVRTTLATLAFLASALMPALANAQWGQDCSLTPSSSSIIAGQSTTLTWSATDGWGVADDYGTVFMYDSGYITNYGSTGGFPGSYGGRVSGSVTVSPSVSTTYTFTAHYGVNTIFYSPVTADCATTISVTPAYAQGSYYAQGAYYSPASCSVSLSPNPKSYAGSATLSWSSSSAHYWVYLNNVGYVGSSGSTSVSPTASTDYSCYAYGYGGSDGWHSAVLSVNPPANCTFNGATVTHGSSVTAYQASSVAYGSSCVSETRSCSNGTLSGTYAYSTCSVLPAPPTCAVSVSPTSVVQGNSSTLSWSSTGATSCTGTNFSTGGATSGSTSVSPSSSTTYTASCTGAGGTASCTGTGSGGVGALLTVSCTPATSYSCSGSTVVQTSTSSACAVTTNASYATCNTPTFCSSGSATCLYNAITGSISASPRIVPSGRTTTVTWSTSNAVACTVTGNGDTWTGTSGSHTSSPITQLVRYTIACDDADADTAQDDYSSSVTVVRVPSWLEI